VLSQPVSGSLLTDPNPDAAFGADGGWVQIVNVDGKTYVYDQQSDNTTGSTGTNGTFNTVDNTWTITTAKGGKIVVDMDNGAYTYTPPANTSGNKVENIGFTLIDRDGDTASANLRINVEGPTLVVGQNVNDQPGQVTPHKVDPVSGTTGQIAGGGSNDILIGDIGGGSLQGKATNVILILDTSGSMSTAFGTGLPSRLQGLQDGVNDMIESLKTSGATDVRVHINHFATEVEAGVAGAQTFDLVINGVVQTANVAAAHSFVNNLCATGFTNYEAGLQEALTWVNGPNEITGANVVNQVVFVSDGQPNTALTGNGTTATAAGSLTTAQAMQHVLGTGSGDTVSEVAQLESNFGPISAIGMGLTAADLAVLSQVEGAGGAARNTTNAAEFKNELSNVSPVSALGAVGNDLITGGTGNDIIFGDSLNTDALAAAKGLGLPPGSGWKVFETLEAGAGWTRADTETYIRSHQSELAAESTATGGAKRAGGNDVIDAGAGNDIVYGQEGNDIIIGGAGNDILSGGSGADTFKWGNADKGTGATPALDTIKDFNPTTTDAANKDVLDLRDLLQGENAGNLSTYLSFSQTGADVTLSVHSAGAAGPVDQKIVLQGVTMAQLAGAGNPADSAHVIANLLANNKLVTD
jgi:Ca2+-binding RTX toxin-like protein